tara:strand:+ start:12610 stop:12852 length:243 start_codon:yes stop_codon:yes gene_type:complete
MSHTHREIYAPAPRRSLLSSIWRLIGILAGICVLFIMGTMLLTGGACIALFSHTANVVDELEEAEREAQVEAEVELSDEQ